MKIPKNLYNELPISRLTIKERYPNIDPEEITRMDLADPLVGEFANQSCPYCGTPIERVVSVPSTSKSPLQLGTARVIADALCQFHPCGCVAIGH